MTPVVNPDMDLHMEAPLRIKSDGLAPDDTIAQGNTVIFRVKCPTLSKLTIRALVTGATADLDIYRLLADGATRASDKPATANLQDGTEELVTITAEGIDALEIEVTNTGAGPDLVVSYVDLFPIFRHPGSLR